MLYDIADFLFSCKTWFFSQVSSPKENLQCRVCGSGRHSLMSHASGGQDGEEVSGKFQSART